MQMDEAPLMTSEPGGTLLDVPGLRVGHAQDETALTGVTVVLCDTPTVGGMEQRGGAPGTRETDPLRPLHNQLVHGVVLAGGSAFGLRSADGVMRFLEERGIGFDVRVARVPIVAAAILFDLGLGRAEVRPDEAMGYAACLNASAHELSTGNVGAGTGASVGKILGIEHAMKAGIGTASIQLGNDIVVGVLVAVNAFGDVISPTTGEIIAGARSPDAGDLPVGAPGYFANTLEVLRSRIGEPSLRFGGRDQERQNTVIGVVATNARLSRSEVSKMAQMAHNGLARTIRPASTMFDGDTIFALSTGERAADVNILGAFAAEALAQAVIQGVRAARPSAGLPAATTP